MSTLENENSPTVSAAPVSLLEGDEADSCGVSRTQRDKSFAGPCQVAFRIPLAPLTACMLLLAGCAVGPKYVRPTVPTPPAFKELPATGVASTEAWVLARPGDSTIHGKWWQAFRDPQLNDLEEMASVSNQTIVAAYDNFLAARALVRGARSQYFPTVTTNPSITNSRPSSGQFGGLKAGSTSGAGFTVKSFTDYSLPFDASWEPDVWGRVRNGVKANVYAAQASAADLENMRLSVQAELAADYFELRAQDTLKQLLDSTVKAYQDALDLNQSLYRAGVGSDEAVAQAEAQLKSAQAEDTNLGILRAEYEHAIAVLVGQPPSTFSEPSQSLQANPPAIPVGIPSELLERRPDIAAAERSVAQANAQIGVAMSAYFPSILLSASGGFGSSSFTNWLTWPSRFWSVGPSLAETIFDAGLRRATMQQYRATYDATVANYRQTVLTAFQQVEDNLVAMRILSEDVQQQDAAVEAARRSLEEATSRYKAGLDPYLNVITAETILLNNQQTALNFRMQEMVSSVQLIKALGGGWNAVQIPSPREIGAKATSTQSAKPQ
jgi:NodT family efflux transporter outer membrane factor (OMF) lipoprotein